MSDEQNAMHDAVERLYAIFEKYPLRRDTEMCTCCHEKDEERKLHSKPLRELSADDLEQYGWSALLTWGILEDFKHFLPRLFELVAYDDSPGYLTMPEAIIGKLRHGTWRDWPNEEQDAVHDYLAALWRFRISEPEVDGDVGETLCAIAQAVDDMTPYLQEWEHAGFTAYRHLASFVIDEAGMIAKRGRLSGAFWTDKRAAGHGSGSDRTPQMSQVIEWLLHPDTKDVLELAFIEHSSDPLARDMATAVDALGYLASLRAAKEERQ